MVSPDIQTQVFQASEWPDLADSCLSQCNIVLQRSELVQKAANGKNRPDPAVGRNGDFELEPAKADARLERSELFAGESVAINIGSDFRPLRGCLSTKR